MDQNVDNERYKLIPRTLIFIFNENEEVLLLKGSPDKRFGAGKYNGLGGHIEKGEGILKGARREVLEEAGIDIPKMDLCGYLMIDTSDDVGIMVFILKARIKEIGKRDDAISSDEGTLEWIHLSEVNEIALIEDLPLLLPKIIAWKRGDPLLTFHYQIDEGGEIIFRSDF